VIEVSLSSEFVPETDLPNEEVGEETPLMAPQRERSVPGIKTIKFFNHVKLLKDKHEENDTKLKDAMNTLIPKKTGAMGRNT
jgi:hypothetical protein